MLAPPVFPDEALDVMFIGDDVDVADLYRLKLQLDGYDVRVVPPDAAVSAARAHRPELVFVDFSSPSTERLQVLQDVRAAAGRPDLPAILVAAFTGATLDCRWPGLTAYDYVISSPAVRFPVAVS